MKKGITLVMLVIIVIVLIILGGAIAGSIIGTDGVVNGAKNTVAVQQRRTLIEDIAKHIQTEQLKKEINGQYTFTVREDVIPILTEYGIYDDTKLILTTYADYLGIEIYLYEMMQIPLEEYVTINYDAGMLSVINSLEDYGIEYTSDGGRTWETYSGEVNVGEEAFVRMVNSEKRVISNTVRVALGTEATTDTTAPIIRITPNTGAGRTINVTIYITESGALSENNVYKYALTNSTTVPSDSEANWVTYTPNMSFIIGEGLEVGTYYMHVKAVSDTSNNTSTAGLSNAYIITDTGSSGGGTTTPIEDTIVPTFIVTENASDNVSRSQHTKLIAIDDSEVTYKYGWSTSNTIPPVTWIETSAKNKMLPIYTNGEYYLWIKDMVDAKGNKAETMAVNGQIVNYVTGAFLVGISGKSVTTEITASPKVGSNGGTIIYTFTFSKEVTGFTTEGITVENGVKGDFAGSGQTYTLEVANGGACTQTVSVLPDACQDASGNGNTMASKTVVIDKNTAPTVTITANVGTKTTTGSNVIYTIQWSEDVSGFTIEDIQVSGGTKGALSGKGDSYVLTVTNATGEFQTVRIPANVCTDLTETANQEGIKSITITDVTYAVGTLGAVLNNGAVDVGTTVSGYTAGGISNWKIFYKKTINGEEYVYLIASNVLTNGQIPTITGATKGTHTNGYGTLYWNSVPAVQNVTTAQTYFMANWSNYGSYNNGKAVSAILNTSNWTNFVDSNYSSYIVGAIGSPTLEMWRESYNAKAYTTSIPTLTTTTYGYSNTASSLQTSDTLYFPKYNNTETNYLLASPSNCVDYQGFYGYNFTSWTHSYENCNHSSSFSYTCPKCDKVVSSSYGYYYGDCPVCGGYTSGYNSDGDYYYKAYYYYLSHSCSPNPHSGIMYSNSTGAVKYDTNVYTFCGVRPVICLQSDIPATRSGDVIVLGN